MNDEDPVNINTELHLQLFEVSVNGARLMLDTINRVLQLQRGTADFCYALFLFTSGQDVMVFFFTNGRTEMLQMLREFLHIQEE